MAQRQLEQQQQNHQQRRSRRAQRALVLAVAAASATATAVGFVSAPARADAPNGFGRREILATAGGILAVGGTTESAKADLFAPPLRKSVYRVEMTEEEKQAMIAQKIGDNLGRIMRLKNGCFETDSKGKVADVSTATVLVWDPDAPCGEGKSYIHAVGPGTFAPMTAAAGPSKHTYYAATIEDETVMEKYRGKVGQCVETPKQGTYEYTLTFEVAAKERGGTCT